MAAFEKLKQICSTETLLYFIDSKLPVFLDVDASQTAYGGLCYQVKTYSKDDLPDLQAKHLANIEKTQNEVNDELQKVLNAYVFQEDIPPYDFNIHPITEETIKETNPHINIATRTKITKDKVYIVHPCFFISKKFTNSQAIGWSSLMKELVAITQTIERRADILCLGQYTIVLSDCSACSILILTKYLS